MCARLVDVIYASLRRLGWLFFRVWCRLEVTGLEHLPRRGGLLLASNHLSFIDPPVLMAACPRRLTFLAKANLYRFRSLALLLRASGSVPVGRRGGLDLGLREAIRRLRQGRAVVIFPEGGRQFTGRLGHARPGAGMVAFRARVPVVPVLIRGTYQALSPRDWIIWPRKIQVAFSPPIDYPVRSSPEDEYLTLAKQITATWRAVEETLACPHKPKKLS